MHAFRYRRNDILADFARSGVGLILAGVPLSLTDGGFATWVLAAIFAVFAGFGLRTALRSRTAAVVSDEGIAVTGGVDRRILWSELASVRLSYYTTNKQNRGGWMQLTVKGAGATIKLDSTLEGFKDLVDRVVAEALARGIDLPSTTRTNLEPLGIRLPKRP